MELLDGLGVTGKALLIDVAPDDNLVRAVANLPEVRVAASGPRDRARRGECRSPRRESGPRPSTWPGW